jgi:hypothetical protein
MHAEVKSLSPHLRDALKSVRYGAADIEVIPAESIEVMVAGGDGMRGFVIGLNLATGERKGLSGSWGGANMFTANPIDSSPEQLAIPPNGCVIKGTTGYPRTFAWIYAHPQAMGRYLASGAPDEELTDGEQQAIYCFAAIKGGEYRRDEMRRRGVTTATVDGLVQRGYLKRNRAGATAITTKGKNARAIRN